MGAPSWHLRGEFDDCDAAKQTGCTVLFSEDMQPAREIDGVRIVNPFQ